MKKLLLADDDRDLEPLVRVMLRDRGFIVDTAHDGTGALAMIENEEYAVVLLDLMMPKMNGIEVINLLTTRSPDIARRVIILTAADPKLLSTIDRASIGGVMLKPFDIEAMTSLVEQVAVAGDS